MITILSESDVIKSLSIKQESCCSNRPIYEITYFLGTKWLVCHECLDLEEFAQDIKEKINLKLQKLSKQDPSVPINYLERDRVESGENS